MKAFIRSSGFSGPALPATAAVLLATALMLYVLNAQGWNPRAFILERSPDVPAGQQWGIGYDAQFYYLIAADPIGAFDEMDLTSLRYQRIIFPLLARALSLGNRQVIPWAMLLINLGAVWLGIYCLSGLIKRRGGNQWTALIWIVSIGYLLALRLDLLEPLSMALALWGWWRYDQNRTRSAMLLFFLAGMTKEVGMVLPAVIGIWELLNRRWGRGLGVIAVTLLPYMAWSIALDRLIAAAGLPAEGANQALFPFIGFMENEEPASRILISIWVVIPFCAAALRAVWDGFKVGWQSQQGLAALMVLGSTGFMSILPAATWYDPIAFFRSTLGGVAVILLWAAVYHPRSVPVWMGLWLPSGIALFAAGII